MRIPAKLEFSESWDIFYSLVKYILRFSAGQKQNQEKNVTLHIGNILKIFLTFLTYQNTYPGIILRPQVLYLE